MNFVRRHPFIIIFIIFLLGAGILVYSYYFSNLSGFSNTKEGSIKITALPANTRVYIDTQGPFELPVTEQLPLGPHEIQLFALGYESKTITATVNIPGETISVSETLDPNPPTLSFFPLSTEPDTLSVWANASKSYYVKGTDVLNTADRLLQARASRPISSVTWTDDGKAVFIVDGKPTLFSPPHIIQTLPPQTTPVFIDHEGSNLVYQNGAGIFSLSLTTKASQGLFSLSDQETIVSAVFSPDSSHALLLLRSQKENRLVLYSFIQKKATVIRAFAASPSFSFSGSGQRFAVVYNNEGVVFDTENTASTSLFKPDPQAKKVVLAPYLTGFILFEKTVFDNDEKRPITKISLVNEKTREASLLLFDAPIQKRIDLSFPLVPVEGVGFIIRDNGGSFYYLGISDKVPKSLFDQLPPQGPSDDITL